MRKRFMIVLSIVLFTSQGLSQIVPPAFEFKSTLGENRDIRIQDSKTDGSGKSVALAVAMSLVLPGMGEWYAGNFESGRYLLAADGSFWLTFAAFRLRGDWLRSDARSFGTQHAGIDFSGKDDQFLVNVGNYNTVEDYNQAKLRERRFDQLYQSPRDSWRWNSEENRLRFRAMRISSDRMYENAKFAVGALVINRIISAFSAGRAAVRSNRAGTDQGAWRVGAAVQGDDAHGMELRVSTEF
jgi:hypothetical protein